MEPTEINTENLSITDFVRLTGLYHSDEAGPKNPRSFNEYVLMADACGVTRTYSEIRKEYFVLEELCCNFSRIIFSAYDESEVIEYLESLINEDEENEISYFNILKSSEY
jgi:hypothetical protein